MKQVNQAGWKLYISRDNPRIAKEDNMRYLMKWGYVIDPSYIFTYEEWQKIINTSGGNSFGYPPVCRWSFIKYKNKSN